MQDFSSWNHISLWRTVGLSAPPAFLSLPLPSSSVSWDLSVKTPGESSGNWKDFRWAHHPPLDPLWNFCTEGKLSQIWQRWSLRSMWASLQQHTWMWSYCLKWESNPFSPEMFTCPHVLFSCTSFSVWSGQRKKTHVTVFGVKSAQCEWKKTYFRFEENLK